MYFWEHDPRRAYQYSLAVKNNQQYSSQVKHSNDRKQYTPFVLGAIIHLNACLNLLEQNGLREVKESYQALKEIREKLNQPIPENKANNRKLDCATINYLHHIRQKQGLPHYTSVRAMFLEGQPLYDNAGFNSQNHLQICVRDFSCVLGFFLLNPRDYK